MQTRFSVIVPVFNSENTIRRCLESIIKDKRQDVEIIVIDDGSSDATQTICKKMAEEDGRIQYFYKNNGGVSSARNVGLSKAKSQCICFVDSDDYVTDDYFEKIDQYIDGTDVLIFGRKIFDGKRFFEEPVKSEYFSEGFHTADYLCRDLKRQKLNLVCDKVFKNDLIQKRQLLFPEDLHIGEDKVFVVRYITEVKKIRRISISIYISSTENMESLSRVQKDDLLDSAIVEHELMEEAVLESCLPKQIKNKYLRALEFSFYRSAYTVLGELEKKTCQDKKRQYKET